MLAVGTSHVLTNEDRFGHIAHCSGKGMFVRWIDDDISDPSQVVGPPAFDPLAMNMREVLIAPKSCNVGHHNKHPSVVNLCACLFGNDDANAKYAIRSSNSKTASTVEVQHNSSISTTTRGYAYTCICGARNAGRRFLVDRYLGSLEHQALGVNRASA